MDDSDHLLLGSIILNSLIVDGGPHVINCLLYKLKKKGDETGTERYLFSSHIKKYTIRWGVDSQLIHRLLVSCVTHEGV